MNVASLELCKELYELSGWKDTELTYYANAGEHSGLVESRGMVFDKPDNMPAYELGYILRKLQVTADWTHGRFDMENYCTTEGIYEWSASYNSYNNNLPIGKANSPEDAAVKLAIELFKQGVLKKEAA